MTTLGLDRAGTLALDPSQREVLLAEAEGLSGSLQDPAARLRYGELLDAVEAGAVEGEAVATLEGLLGLLLETGRARRHHGPESERALLRLFHQTPRGVAARRALDAVNEALAGLAGQVLENALFTLQSPGVYRLGLQTDRCRLTLEIGRHGLSVESVEV